MKTNTLLHYVRAHFARLFLSIMFIFFFFPTSLVYAGTFSSQVSLGLFEEGTVKLAYYDVILNTYNAHGTNYVAVSDLRLLGCDVSYTPSPKMINILPPSCWQQTTTAPCANINLSSYAFYDGDVYLGNLKTCALLSDNRVFIPVAALSDLGSLNISDGICTFTPLLAPPVMVTDTYILNLTSSPIETTVIDLYWSNEALVLSNTYALAPGEILERTPLSEDNTLYITSFVQTATGDDLNYTNSSYRGQLNTSLLERYVRLKDHAFLEDYGDPITFEEVIAAEDFINSKNLSSPTQYLVWTNIAEQKTYIFTGSQNNWSLLKCFICSTGRDHTPTPTGTYALTYKVSSFGQSKGYCCKYAFGFIGTTYLYHSIIYDKTGTYLLEGHGVLGKKASQGCIRFSPENAKWFYDHLISKTTVYITK